MTSTQQTVRWAWAGECWLGAVWIEATPAGVSRVRLGEHTADNTATETFSHNYAADDLSVWSAWRDAVLRQIDDPASDAAAHVPLSLQGTPLQQQVWLALRAIQPGRTVSYGELARRLGRPTSVRAVAAACGANPIAVLIPCHRVLGSDGRLTGYRWGLEIKRRLLEREQAADLLTASAGGL